MLFYFQIERDRDGEVIAIGKNEEEATILTHNTVYLRQISQAVYETYQAFGFPEFKEYEPLAPADHYNWYLVPRR